jgi:subfamily B ATP-binding cassette protein MsbA
MMRSGSLHRLWSDRDGAVFIIRRVLREYGSRYWRSYAAALLLGGIAGGCTSLAAYLISGVINEAYVYRSATGLLTFCGIVIVIFASKGLALYGQAITLARVSNQIIAESQWRMFDKFLRQNLGYFADRHSSEFMALCAYAAAAPATMLSLLVNTIGRDVLTLIGLSCVMVVQDPLLSLITLVVLPPTVIFTRGLVKQARSLAFNQYHSSANVLETVQETLQGLRVVKAFNLEDGMRQRVAESVTAGQRAGNEMARIANRTGPLMETLGGIAIALVLGYGGYRVIAFNASPGEFFSFITAFILAYEPVKRLTQLNITLHNNVVAVRTLFEVMDAPESEPDDADKPDFCPGTGGIEFANVNFAYRASEPVLRNLSFIAAPGRMTALVGPSGGGKSTIFSLLLRFYDVDSGTIRIARQNICAVSRRSLRAQIGYVGQDVFLFKGLIRDNIAAGNRGASEEQIIEAAKAAFAHDFITAFPRGYDTPVGELGTQLSAGQRQRIAVARALLKDARFILLDEPTSALDSESERQVAEAIDRLCAGRTTLVIAHRLHTIVRADCIHVIEQGAVVETGTHAELMRRSGRYASLYRLMVQEQTPASDRVVPMTASG